MLYRLGVDAINVPDSPRASARMSAQSLCVQIQQQVGIETVLHYTCRDRNVLSIQSDLLGASSIGLKNILCLTGDPPKLGNYPDATAVFDVDAIGLVNVVHNLNYGLDIGKNSIGESTGFTIAVAANPGVPDIDQEVRRFAYKVEAGAEYAITQPVFDLRVLEEFLKRIEGFRIPVIAGIWPLTSLRNAEFMKNDLRVSMPDEIMARMAAVKTPEAAQDEGVKIAQEMLAEAESADGAGGSGERAVWEICCGCGRCWGLTMRRGGYVMAKFEEQLTALETCGGKAGAGELSLEESVRLFEEGVRLSNACKKELEAAEGRIQVLVEKQGGG